MQMELRMDASNCEERAAPYKTSHRVQAWFLGRSRRRWKQKYKKLKVEAKRLQNRVADVTKSREKWRQQAKQLSQRVQELETQNAALPKQAAALKKYGPRSSPGVG
jgi:septal ring factor EnvC (AmiA/AmiB activator)